MFDVAIIGCGITGAAIAYELSKYNLNIVILEKANDVATGATRANSAIIHAGYDPKEGTLMARLNVRGAELAEKICGDLDVPYVKNGAMVLGFSEEDRTTIEKLYRRGGINGVKDLEILTAEQVKEMEPGVGDKVICALYAPGSAICSPWEYCLAMAETAVKNGAVLKLNAEVKGIERIEKTGKIEQSGNIDGKSNSNFGEDDYFVVIAGNEKYEARYVINATGCDADTVHDMVLEHSYDIFPNRGEYYLLDKSEGKRVARTIFQCPSEKGKGVLVSPTVHGNLIVGPNSEGVEGVDTATTRSGLDFVKTAAVRSVPEIDFSANIRNFAGVRAKSSVNDFIITEQERFIDVAGICSPGLSSAPAIGEYVAELLDKAMQKSSGKYDGESTEKPTEKLNNELTLNSDYAALRKLVKKDNFINHRKRIRVKEMSASERAELVKKNPDYGEVVCRCEGITKGEILDAFSTSIPPCSVDGVKRRVSAGMGRCQGGFCSPVVVQILAQKLGVDRSSVVQDLEDSVILKQKMVIEESNESVAAGITGAEETTWIAENDAVDGAVVNAVDGAVVNAVDGAAVNAVDGATVNAVCDKEAGHV